MKQCKTLKALAVVTMLAAVAMATLPMQAQEEGPLSDLIFYSAASNPGGLVGLLQVPELTNTSEFFPAFLQAAANVPNNTGIYIYEPQSTTVGDQLWVQNGYWYFASDPDLQGDLQNFQKLGITLVGTVEETGLLQDVSSFFGLPPSSIEFMSDIPEPSTSVLAGLSAAMLLIFRRRR